MANIEDIEFPTSVCPDTAPHARHRISGTWRTECTGVESGNIDQSRAPFTKRQTCRYCLNSCVPAITLTFDSGARRLHWCAKHASDAERYIGHSDQR